MNAAAVALAAKHLITMPATAAPSQAADDRGKDGSRAPQGRERSRQPAGRPGTARADARYPAAVPWSWAWAADDDERQHAAASSTAAASRSTAVRCYGGCAHVTIAGAGTGLVQGAALAGEVSRLIGDADCAIIITRVPALARPVRGGRERGRTDDIEGVEVVIPHGPEAGAADVLAPTGTCGVPRHLGDMSGALSTSSTPSTTVPGGGRRDARTACTCTAPSDTAERSAQSSCRHPGLAWAAVRPARLRHRHTGNRPRSCWELGARWLRR